MTIMRFFWMILVLCPAMSWSAAATMDAPALPDDWRTVRSLEQKANGAPNLPAETGSTGDMVLNAAGLAVTANDLSASDYNALFALLQRYRDELTGMGLDYDKLANRLESLVQRSEDLKDRLDKYHPLDGAKIHGRVGVWYDDMHIMGHKTILGITSPATAAKAAKLGYRFQSGFSRADILYEITRGPISGIVEMDVATAWTSGVAVADFRQFYFEFRTPVAMQFGSLDVNLTPLTLWRNEDAYPYEPEPYKSRRQRATRNYNLVPDKWRLFGARLSTEILFFNTVPLVLESTTTMVGQPFGPGDSYFFPVTGTAYNNATLANVHTNYLEAWRASIPLSFGLEVSYQGTLTTDDPQSRPLSGYRRMEELVHSGRAQFKGGIFFADMEYASSSYMPNGLTRLAEPGKMTGTAFVGSLGIQAKMGGLKFFGRSVAKTFHAAGAQGRTQDRNYEFTGPMMTEISYVNSSGGTGYPNVPLPPQDIWNTVFIPAGVVIRTSTPAFISTGPYDHLLPYNYLSNISPYGQATPNRQGYGASGNMNLWKKLIMPSASFETNSHLEPVSNTVDAPGRTSAAFTYQQIRVGLETNFTLGWGFRLSGGHTMGDAKNGGNSRFLDSIGQAVPFGLTYGLTEAGLEVWPTEKLGLFVANRHLESSGVSDTERITLRKGTMYNSYAYGLKWNITESAMVDVVYENAGLLDPETRGVTDPQTMVNEYVLEAALLRVFINF